MLHWRKQGKLFDPRDYSLPCGCVEYAQAPQALVNEDYIRIYFSTRSRDSQTTWLSHICSIDCDRALSNVVAVSRNEVVSLGGLGDFDEHGIFPMNVLRVGNRIHGYTGGIHRMKSVPIDGAIGLVISENGGESFARIGPGPVLAATLHEPFLIADPFTSIIDGTFHMWYIFGVRWMKDPDTGRPERVYKIGHATSGDGIHWKKEGRKVITDKIDENECQAMPTVFHYNDSFHMLFCYRNAFNFKKGDANSYRLGYAVSSDCREWMRDDAAAGIGLSEAGWDCEMMCYPHVVKVDGSVYLLYNGNEFGRRGFGVAVLES